MSKAPTPCLNRFRLPKLAAATLVFWGLSALTPLDAAPNWSFHTHVGHNAILSPDKQGGEKAASQLHLLSAKDAALYREAFAAQEKEDWKTADAALAQATDKRLSGHVLADRYNRRGVTLEEAQNWLAAYPDLPEATEIYEQAQHNGVPSIHLTHPVTPPVWLAHGESSGASGFHPQRSNSETLKKTPLGAQITVALHRGDPSTAQEVLEKNLQSSALSPEDAHELEGQIAAAFFYEGDIEHAKPLAQKAAHAGMPLGLWISGLSAWKQKDYTTAAHAFTALARQTRLSAWDHAAASYWAYRTARRAGDTEQANRWLEEAAKHPHSFYGYMATSLRGHPPALSWKLPELNTRALDTLTRYQAGWQAVALMQIGKTDLAESELRRLNPAGQHDLQNAVLALAGNGSMPSLSLQLASLTPQTGAQMYEGAGYPLPPWRPASGFKVDRALIYALIRRESLFDPEAVSQSGACGLMQIMPSTAHHLGQEPAGHGCSDALLDPTQNIETGQKYVRVLAGQPMIGDNLLFLLVAYNGGPGNLARWISNDNRSDPLLFLESLPVRETRDYVQEVLLHYWMYRTRLSLPENASAQLAHGEWPRYALHDDSGERVAERPLVEVASEEIRMPRF